MNLNQPYPLNESIKWRLTHCFLFSTFVFLFLFIFQPFELSKLSKNQWLIALGYGAVCFTIMVLLNVGLFLLFPTYFSEKNWTTKREILWAILNLFLIGLCNCIFSFLIKITPFTWQNLFLFEFYTIAVGVFPITISILLNQARLSSKFERKSQQLNESIEKNRWQFIPQKITLNNGTKTFELAIEQFVFAKSADNYVEIYYLDNALISRKILRNTLKNVDAHFAEHKTIFKCHKSYIVNLNHVKHISGNAQGYKLHLKKTAQILPVSRALNATIKQLFTHQP